jgi:hypothetical protein
VASAAQAGADCKAAETVQFEALGITVDSSITGNPGATAADGHGCDGGDVFVFTSFRDIVLEPEASIRGGRGGNGGIVTRRTGVTNACTSGHGYSELAPGSSATFERTGNGGDGGNVTLQIKNVAIGTDVVGREAAVVGGDGGDDGFVGDAGEPQNAVTAPDGTYDQGGGDVGGISGNGGRGGDATLLEKFLIRGDRRSPFGRGGSGGAPGGGVLRAGDGGPPNCDGGDFYFGAGLPGAPGTGALQPPMRHAPLHKLSLFGGDAYSGVPPVPLNGGSGGSAFVYDQAARIRGALHEAELALVATIRVGNGGPGSDGCVASPPVQGGLGGAGGDLGRYFGGPAGEITGSFNGNAGGDGNPAGGGGSATEPPKVPKDFNTVSFRPGTPGSLCPGSPPARARRRS